MHNDLSEFRIKNSENTKKLTCQNSESKALELKKFLLTLSSFVTISFIFNHFKNALNIISASRCTSNPNPIKTNGGVTRSKLTAEYLR